jgi:inner membrane protein involved in colicin E2 resistance
VGVILVNPSDHYALTIRAVKHAVVFTFLTFVIYSLFERGPASGRLKAAQLALIALTMGLFCLALLGLSEHLAFGLSIFLA